MRNTLLVLSVALTGALWPAVCQTVGREFHLTIGESTVLDCDFDVYRIPTTAPEVIDAVALSRREVLLLAKGHGFSTVGLWSREGQRVLHKFAVVQDLAQVRELLKRTFPEESIEVQGAREALSLTGRVSSKDIADRAAALVAPLAKSVVNNLAVAPPPPEKQITLRVKFAELKAAASFGLSLISTGALNTIARVTTGQFSAPQPLAIGGGQGSFTLSDALNVFAFRPDLNLGAFLQALQREGVLQVLAEPNLVTANGKEASFLVGGEFPVPVVQGGANAGA